MASGASPDEAGYVVKYHHVHTLKQAEEIIKMLLVVADLNDDWHSALQMHQAGAKILVQITEERALARFLCKHST